MSDVLLRMAGISKAFGSNRVLENVNLELKKGEVLALLGENGAGKSTLIKILGGIYNSDGGEIYIEGERKQMKSSAVSQECGVRIIHQEIVLVPHRTIAANIYLGREPKNHLGLVDYKKMAADAKAVMNEYEIELDPDQNVQELSIGQQQQVEIVKAVSANAKIVVMDEPTSSLTEKETNILFRIIRKLQTRGVGIIYISHRIEELFTICDRVMVLRDGIAVDTLPVRETTKDHLVGLMVGRKLEKYYVRTEHELAGEALRVVGLGHKKYFHDINFHVNYGEIIGFSGLMGAGRSEVMKTIFGIFSKESGEILLEGREIKINKPRDAMKAGIAYVPENRKTEGLVLINHVKFNMGIANLEKLVTGVRVNHRLWDSVVENYIVSLHIKVSSARQNTGSLSGGNQQKVVLGKWLSRNPKVIILDEPTRGIDVGSKAEIYEIINDLAGQGAAVILVSSDLPEIINMCDRVYVMAEGRITGELNASEITQEKIMHFSTTIETEAAKEVQRHGSEE